ncbi:mediator of DNA damage checkpoint protein 1, partial [Clarias magur]
MDATQQIEGSFIEEVDDSDEEHEDGEGKGQREQLAVLKVFKNNHIPETEVPLYQGENVLGRDPSSCSVPLQARSVSGRHAIISVSVFGRNDRQAHSEATEALLWDLGSLNGTRKGRLKLTPHVRYALTDGDGLVLADLPCQYVSLKNADTFGADNGREKAKGPTSASGSSQRGTGKGAENGGRKSALPPVPVWTEEAKGAESVQTTPKRPERTLVPESDSDSDGERHGRRDRKRIVVSDSASSDLSSPTCSTFLTPANKVIPESEDESSITPSSMLKGRFLKTGNHTEVSSDSPKQDQLLFNIDSDTDVEDEEEEMTKSAPKTVDAVTPADLHMDSDTDVEDEDIEKAKSDPVALAAPAKQDTVNPAVLNMDSDTDVEDNESVKTPTTTVLPGAEVSLEEKKDADSSSGQLHLESDTDVEDEDDVPRIQDSKPPTSHVAEFNLNSDTDVEEDEDETTQGNEAESKGLEPKPVDSVQVPAVKMSHDQSDIDTDVEDDDTEIRTPATAEVTGKSQTGSENQTADASSANVQPGSPAKDEAPLRLDSDTDVEEDEEKMEGKEQKCAESAVQIVHSSTPKGVSGEELETQAFLSPSQLFKRPGLPSLLHPSVSPGGISHPDDDFAVAETQSFVCDAAQPDATLDETPESLDGPESRHSHGASSFQLSSSDSSHQLPEAAEHDGEPAEEEWQLQATQLYAMKNSEGSTKAGEMQQDLDSTQAYVCATGQEEKEDGGKEEEEQETEPLDTQSHSSIHTAETQLIKPRALNEDNSDRDTNEKVVASEPEIKAEEDAGDEMQVDSHLSTADTLLLVRSPRQEEHTQPYAFLTAQIQKEHEETEKEEHESRDLEDGEDEGERAQEEEITGMDKENELPREEEKKERGENETVENNNEVNEAQTQPAEAEPIAETLPMCEEEEGQEEEQMNERRSSRGTQPAHVESTQRLEPDDLTCVAIAETLPMCEEEDEQDEEQLNEPCSSRGTHPAQVESTQPLESDDQTHVAVAETLPMCEEEEEQEEEKNKPRNSRRPGRKRPTVKVETKQPVESDKVTRVSVAETQPMSEDEEEQEEEQRSETTSTRRSSTRRRGAKTKPPVATPETLPRCEEEEGQEEAPPSEAVSGRKSRRGRQSAKVETARAVEPDSATETVKVEEVEEMQDSSRNLRGRAASGKGKGRGRAAAEKEKRGKRGKREQDEDSEEKLERGNKGRGRKSLRLKSKDDDMARLELMEAGKEEMDHVKKQEEEEENKRLQMEKKEEARDRLEREESARLEKERVEREEREKLERMEREKKEREEKEMKEREEMERLEREKQLEKERREQEEKDRLEQERIEKENKEKEEKERLGRELREKQELEKERREQEEKDRLQKARIEKENREKEEKERLEREMLEKERKKQEEKDRLEKEKRNRKEKEEREKKSREEKEKQEQEMKQKESKDDTEDMEKEKRPAPGKRKVGLQRRGRKSKKEEDQELEEGTKEGLETKQELMQKEECEEGNGKKQEDEQADGDSKTRRGRRTTRKSVAPPAGAEDEGGPAKRTRSRSNSSNSVCSEQSAQDSSNGGRGEIRRTVPEQKDKGRPSGRRRTNTTTAPSSEKEEIKQASNTRSNSRSSERSSSSAATPSRGRGRKRSVKVEETEEEEEREQLAPVGRGRGRGKGRGGKHPGGNDIKEEKAEKEKPEVMAVAEDGQSSSRGRKRGVDVSMPMEETPQPTPKTPRRSLAGQAHKVLFTGVVDEDGEKVVVRLGGDLAKGVADMTHLVTDKVRRTVKFLCAVARGVPIVTPDWLSKCGKTGSFLSPNGFLVKDIEQEKRFNFSLQEALRVASSQPLLQGYEIHVTPSVKPEPAHMKEIITCCGARFLPKMPSAHK